MWVILLRKNTHWIRKKNPDISNLATKAALTTVGNKIPSVSNLVKKNRL